MSTSTYMQHEVPHANPVHLSVWCNDSQRLQGQHIRAPHPINGALAAAVGLEPVSERHPVQRTHITHAALGVNQRSHHR